MHAARRGPAPGGPRGGVTIVGLGNIGSHLVPHLARIPGVVRVVLVDHGRYDASNLRSQGIGPGDVGQLKTTVQRRRLRRISPALRVTAIAAPVEAVPLGSLRADVILGCVDGRAARQHLSQSARHLGVPLVDAGVLADGLLARVSTFLPGPRDACLECAWDQADYDAIEQAYPCRDVSAADSAPEAPPTGAPAPLGALAAALQALECQRLLAGTPAAVDGSFEIVIDAATHRQQLTRIRRNPDCRLAEHGPWTIRALRVAPRRMPVARALELGPRIGGRRAVSRLSLEGAPFVTALRCRSCGAAQAGLRLWRPRAERPRACPACGGTLVAAGPDIVGHLVAGHLDGRRRALTLAAVGIRPHDVLAVRRGDRRWFYEVADARDRNAAQEG